MICLVTDRRRLAPHARTCADEVAELERLLDQAIESGVDLIQIRELDLEPRTLLALTARTVQRTVWGGTRILLNDRADVARAGRAHGVHLRADGPPVARVRSLEPGWTIGRSLHAGDDVALGQGANYVLFGPVFRTRSKPAGVPPAGPEALADVVRASIVPVLAIGGVTLGGARICREAGAAGVAAVDLFLPEGRAPTSVGVARAVSALRISLAEGAC